VARPACPALLGQLVTSRPVPRSARPWGHPGRPGCPVPLCPRGRCPQRLAAAAQTLLGPAPCP
jgi:hypothetical protein